MLYNILHYCYAEIPLDFGFKVQICCNFPSRKLKVQKSKINLEQNWPYVWLGLHHRTTVEKPTLSRLYTHWKIRPGKVSQSTINLSLIWAFNDLMIKFNLQNALCLRNLLNAVSNDAWGLKRQFAMRFPSLIWCDDTFLMNFYFITKIALWLRHNGASCFFWNGNQPIKFHEIYFWF